MRRISTFGVIVFCICLALQLQTLRAQTAGPYEPLSRQQIARIVGAPDRVIVSLAGQWERRSDDEVTTVAIPRSVMHEVETTYSRTFTIEESMVQDMSWQLLALGAGYRTDIRINNQYLGSHIGGSAPFNLRIPNGALRSGLNTIEIVINNVLDPSSTVPPRRGPLGSINFGGIYREIYLVGSPHVWVGGVSVQTAFASGYGSARVDVNALVSSGMLDHLVIPVDTLGGDSADVAARSAISSISVSVEAELVGPGGQVFSADLPLTVDLEPERNLPAKLSINVDQPQLWSPQSPGLHTLRVRLRVNGGVVDTYERRIGLYDLDKSDGAALRLNGKALVINAVEYVEHIAGRGRTLNAAEMEADVRAMKTLGANVVRARHAAPHPHFVNLCDAYGLFVLIDLPVQDVPDGIIGSDNFIATSENLMREYLEFYDLNPSVLGWGVSDGLESGAPGTQRYEEAIMRIVRDGSQNIAYKSVRQNMTQLDPDNVDLLMLSMHTEDLAVFRAELERLRGLSNGKPLIVGFGTVVQAGNHNGYSDPLSEEAKAKFLRDRVRAVRESRPDDGVMVWSFNSYQTARPILTNNYSDPYAATSGLMDAGRESGLAFDVVRALFNDEEEPFITAGTYRMTTPFIYTIVCVVMIIVFFVIINSSRRFRENVMRALVRPYNFYADIRDQRILSNARTVLLSLLLSSGLGIVVSALLYHLRGSFELDYLLNVVIVSDRLKEIVDLAVWSPELSILAGTLIFLSLFFGVALAIRLGSMFVRSRIFFNDAFVIAVWAGLPALFLLLPAMGIYQLLELGGFVPPVILLLLLLGGWILYRVLRGTAVIYDVWAPNVYVTGIALLLVIGIAVVVYMDAVWSSIDYVNYFARVILP